MSTPTLWCRCPRYSGVVHYRDLGCRENEAAKEQKKPPSVAKRDESLVTAVRYQAVMKTGPIR